MVEPSLLQYIRERNPQLDETNLLKRTEFDTRYELFRAFLMETRVVPHECTEVSTKTTLTAELLSLSYPQFIDALARTRLGQKNGFSTYVGSDTLGITNFHTNLLKSTLWERLCETIGRQAFTDMLRDVSCFLRPEGNITFRFVAFAKKAYSNVKPRRKFHMYFREGLQWTVTRLLLHKPEQLARLIFNCGDQLRHLPKRFRPLVQLLRKAKASDQKLHYHHILHNIVRPRELKEALFENAVPFAQVTRFVFVVVHRIFPNDTFGCQANWNVINDCIYEILRTERTETIDVRAIVQRLKVTLVPWLGRSARASSKQDYMLRMKALSDFVRWFLSGFIIKLVSVFWYVTANPVKTKPGEPNNAFFLHESWKKMSQLWLQEYVLKYLHVETAVSETHKANANFNCGTLRLVPKETEFRPLCIPLKTGRNSVENTNLDRARLKKLHFLYDFNVMGPIRDILRNKQYELSVLKSTPFPRCNSVNDVGKSIAAFKATLLSKFDNQLPALFGVQFDMRHCYDNLNQGRIFSCIEALFLDDSVSEEYILRKYVHSSRRGDRFPAAKNIIKSRCNVQEMDIFEHNPLRKKTQDSVYGDKTRTLKFTRSDVLDLVRSHVVDAMTELPKSDGAVYKRTRGVFQGFPLSGTLCDVVYNSLVDNVLATVKSETHGCLLLRLADDFLFISTEKRACEMMLERARSRESKEYGAHVNLNKTSWNDATQPGKERALFLGLAIDLRTLSIERSESFQITLSNHIRRSLKASLAYLDWRFRLRSCDFLFDLRLLDFATVCKNVREAYVPTLECALICALEARDESDVTQKIATFATQMLLTVLQKFQAVNGESYLCSKLFKEMWQILQEQFKEHKMAFRGIQQLLS